MLINFPKTPKEMRGAIEAQYDDAILSADIIETIVDNTSDYLSWSGWATDDIISEMGILTKTLSWSSEYNRQNNG